MESDEHKTNLDTYLIIFLLQHPIFMVSRIPIFILYAMLTCCCDKGIEYNDDEQFKHTILHFDFIATELGELHNFENHFVGVDELRFQRNLSFVRRQTIRDR